MARLLLEDDQGEFIVDRNAISESKSDGGATLMEIPGRFSMSDEINGNHRTYPKAVWEKQLKEDAQLMELIRSNSCFGLLEHPKDGIVDLSSPISHMVIEATMNPSGEVRGKIRVLNTNEGRKLAALIEAGYNPRVSSRGFGSVVDNGSGVLVVQEDYVCEGWDCVLRPSCATAVLSVPRENMASNHLQGRYESFAQFEAVDKLLSISKSLGYSTSAEAWKADPTFNSSGKGVTESKDVVAPIPAAQQKVAENVHPKTTMSLTSIKEQLAGLASTDPSKLEPLTLAENLRTLDSLHRATANALTEDSKLSWEAAQLHESIKRTEQRYFEAIERPRVALKESQEQVQKLLKVVRTIAETAQLYRKSLSEGKDENAKLRSLIKEVANRGRGWQKRALKSEKNESRTSFRYKYVLETLDATRKLYKEDSVALGRRYLQLRYEAQLKADPELSKKLQEAKKTSEVLEVRTKLGILESKGKKSAGKTDGISESKTTTAPKPSKTSSKAVTEAAPSTVEDATVESKETTVIFKSTRDDPRNLGEAVEISQRMFAHNHR